jgi:glutathione transport system ATP-binding protein
MQQVYYSEHGGNNSSPLPADIPSPIRLRGDEPVTAPLVEIGPGHFVARHPVGIYG